MLSVIWGERSLMPLIDQTKQGSCINGPDMETGDVVFGRPILPYSANKNICNAKTYDVILILEWKSSLNIELNLP